MQVLNRTFFSVAYRLDNIAEMVLKRVTMLHQGVSTCEYDDS